MFPAYVDRRVGDNPGFTWGHSQAMRRFESRIEERIRLQSLL